MGVAAHPLHRSGRARLAHPALALGGDARPSRRILMTYPLRLLAVSAPAHFARLSGPVPGSCFAVAISPWPAPFAPPAPPSAPRYRFWPRRLCSRASSLLRVCPTSCFRSSSPYVLRLLDATQGCCLGWLQALPVLAQVASVLAWGLRPRGIPTSLARAVRWLWPSPCGNRVGIPN